MKTAVVIDPVKIKMFKEKIVMQAYVDHAIDQLAYEIAWIFI